MLKDNASFSERLKKSINGIKVECAKNQDTIHYRLSVKKSKEIIIEFIVEDEHMNFNTYHANSLADIDDSIFYIQRDNSVLPIYVIETECYNCFIGNYIRENLSDIEDVEEIVKFFCEFVGIGYANGNKLEVEILDREEFNREVTKVGEEFIYALFARNIYSLGYLNDNYVYATTTQKKLIRITLKESVLGLISMVLLNEEDSHKKKLNIARILNATLYGMQLSNN